jgi:predicted AlkP superfamily pyrophosphatase or phosphodiesterase
LISIFSASLVHSLSDAPTFLPKTITFSIIALKYEGGGILDEMSKAKPLVVINVVGLTHSMLGKNTPNISALAATGFSRPLHTVFPAVTCSVQSSLLTGLQPSEHGIVGNGWYDRELAEVFFWRQSNRLVQGERIYDAGRKVDPSYTTAKMFWWYNMYADVDFSVTPRPTYPADGRKVFDSYSQPPTLKDSLQDQLGMFPLMKFWGPGADITSSAWIADASVAVFERHRPSLTLVYLPHLDYNLQRYGPSDPRITQDIAAVDAETGKVIQSAQSQGADVAVVSEYAITPVSSPVHINRILREHGFLRVRQERTGWETLDCGASRAFAVADHQVAHVYIKDQADVVPVRTILEATSGVEFVLSRERQRALGVEHQRAGELIAVAEQQCWFTYYFWLDDQRAPDYARTVDIHRKPGYDPVELFLDKNLSFPKARIAKRLLQKKLGLRYLMDVIGLDATVVKGSHGRVAAPGREATDSPVFVCSARSIEADKFMMTGLKKQFLRLQFGT